MIFAGSWSGSVGSALRFFTIVLTFTYWFLKINNNKFPPVFVFRMKKDVAWRAVLKARLLLQTWRDRGRHRARAPPPPSNNPQTLSASLGRFLQRSPLPHKGLRFSSGLVWSRGSGYVPQQNFQHHLPYLFIHPLLLQISRPHWSTALVSSFLWNGFCVNVPKPGTIE